MKTYSSSDFKMFIEHCPKALEFAENNTPRDTSQMDYGVVSHAILEAVGNEENSGPLLSSDGKIEVANRVCKELITNGRTFRGLKQPPISPENAFEGKKVALKWLSFNDLPDDASYEIELQHCRFKALHDCVWLEHVEDEYQNVTTVVTRDWKGWQGRESELETWQRKLQAITLWRNYPDADAIRLEICNLQTHQIFDKTITLDNDGVELLEQWQIEAEMICDAIHQTREARPGVGCLSCPYSAHCKERLPSNYEEWETPKNARRDSLAQYLAFLKTEQANIIKELKERQELPVGIEGGYVGWKVTERNVLVSGAYESVFDSWFLGKSITTENARSLLKALNLGVANINALSKVLFDKEDKAMREDFLDQCFEKKTGQSFGVWKNAD